MNNEFFKFPSTPHLVALDGTEVRDDKVLSEAERKEFLQHQVVVEEKVDGANLGISFDSEGAIYLQNRGSILKLPGAGQWKNLEQWIDLKTDEIFEVITDRFILFGEWCYAKHSVYYNQLPDWFLGFDLYDKKNSKFLSTNLRDKAFGKMGISKIPLIETGYFTLSKLAQLLTQSRLSDQPAEGLYLRVERDDWLSQRAKLVRPSFIQSVEQHWSRSSITPNQLDLNVWEEPSD